MIELGMGILLIEFIVVIILLAAAFEGMKYLRRRKNRNQKNPPYKRTIIMKTEDGKVSVINRGEGAFYQGDWICSCGQRNTGENTYCVKCNKMSSVVKRVVDRQNDKRKHI